MTQGCGFALGSLAFGVGQGWGLREVLNPASLCLAKQLVSSAAVLAVAALARLPQAASEVGALLPLGSCFVCPIALLSPLFSNSWVPQTTDRTHDNPSKGNP